MAVPQSFPAKIYQILENESPDIIQWNENGISFRIMDHGRFEREIVPKYFRHNQISSVQRQLNLYGFKCISRGEYKRSFFHPKFKRGDWDTVKKLTRYIPLKKSSSSSRNDDGSPSPTQDSFSAISSQTAEDNKQTPSGNVQMYMPYMYPYPHNVPPGQMAMMMHRGYPPPGIPGNSNGAWPESWDMHAAGQHGQHGHEGSSNNSTSNGSSSHGSNHHSGNANNNNGNHNNNTSSYNNNSSSSHNNNGNGMLPVVNPYAVHTAHTGGMGPPLIPAFLHRVDGRPSDLSSSSRPMNYARWPLQDAITSDGSSHNGNSHPTNNHPVGDHPYLSRLNHHAQNAPSDMSGQAITSSRNYSASSHDGHRSMIGDSRMHHGMHYAPSAHALSTHSNAGSGNQHGGHGGASASDHGAHTSSAAAPASGASDVQTANNATPGNPDYDLMVEFGMFDSFHMDLGSQHTSAFTHHPAPHQQQHQQEHGQQHHQQQSAQQHGQHSSGHSGGQATGYALARDGPSPRVNVHHMSHAPLLPVVKGEPAAHSSVLSTGMPMLPLRVVAVAYNVDPSEDQDHMEDNNCSSGESVSSAGAGQMVTVQAPAAVLCVDSTSSAVTSPTNAAHAVHATAPAGGAAAGAVVDPACQNTDASIASRLVDVGCNTDLTYDEVLDTFVRRNV